MDEDAGPSVRVVVADDHPEVSAALLDLLNGSDEIEVVAVVDTAEAAVTATQQLQPDVAILDAAMPGGGLTAARHLAPSDVRVVMLTADDGPDGRHQAEAAGVELFLVKSDGDDLVQAVLDTARPTP